MLSIGRNDNSKLQKLNPIKQKGHF